MPYIRKDAAGADSLGHVWANDGDIVEMPHEDAEQLLAIPDGGFTLADGPAEPQPVDDDGAPILPPNGSDSAPEQTPHPEMSPEDAEPTVEPEASAAEEPEAAAAVEPEAPAKPATRRGRKPAATTED